MRDLEARTNVFVQDLADQAPTAMVLALGPLGGGRNYFYIDGLSIGRGVALAVRGQTVIAQFPVNSTAWLVLGAEVLEMLSTQDLLKHQQADHARLSQQLGVSEPDVPDGPEPLPGPVGQYL